MNLISTLNAGIAAAANGWAELYIRGTSTRATWYADFEASTSNSSGANIPLDAYGAVEVYVNQLVDVVAKSADGTVIRSWTDGYSSPNVEVISPSFTGADYVSGATAVNEPTTLKSVLDRWLTSAGSPDWKVSIGGSPTTMEDAFGALDGLVYNVKSPQFGAVGDGVANDQGAITAAIAAAGAAGGGIVFFPEGTYLTTTSMALDNTVSLMGVGAGRSIISVNSASERVFHLFSAVSSATPFVVQGLTFRAGQSNTASQVYIGATTSVSFRDCSFTDNANAIGIGLEYDTSAIVDVRHCVFNIQSGTLPAIQGPSSSSTSVISIYDTRLITPSAYVGSMVNLRNTSATTVMGCLFDGVTNSTFGTNVYCVETTSRSTVVGNSFRGTVFKAAVYYNGGTGCHASGNTFVGVLDRYATTALLAKGSKLELGPMEDVFSSATPVVPDCVETVQMRSTSTVPVWTMPTQFYPGQILRIVVINSSGAGWATPNVFAGAFNVSGTPSPNVANAGSAAYEFVVCDLSGSYVWRRYYTIG